MTFEQYKKATKEQLIEYGKTIPLGRTYDNGRISSCKLSDGNWYKYLRSENKISYMDTDGEWWEETYKDGKETSYADSTGNYEVNGEEVYKEEYDAFIKGLNNDIRTI